MKSWDFAGWRQRYGHGSFLPYRMDYLERNGVRLHWTDAVHRPSVQSTVAVRTLRRVESVGVPFAQTLLMGRTIRSSQATLAMFESEANFLALTRSAGLTSSRRVLAVLTCWLAHILSSCGTSRLLAYQRAYRSVNLVYYLSANQGPILEDRLKVSAAKLRYLPFGVDVDEFVPTGQPDADYLLVVGRDRGRDWPTLLDAVSGIDLPVKICCRPNDLSGLSVPRNVEVVGYVDVHEYRSLLSRARVVAVATRPVAYPSGQTVLLEAMSMGRAVVVTRAPALKGYIRPSEDCLAVEVGDSLALRGAIMEAAGDGDLRARLGAAGRRSVVENFSAARMWTTVAEDLHRLTRVESRSK